MRYAVTVSLVAAAGLLSSQNPSAQETNVHLNPVVAKLAAGTVVYGLANAGDFSLANTRETARAPVDFVYADLEHNALDLPGLVESVEGVKQVDAIATVPGVGALFVAGRQDLSRSIGVPLNSPEVETAVQRVLSACKSHKVACAITELSASDVVRRVKEGWNIIRSTVPAIVEARKVLD